MLLGAAGAAATLAGVGDEAAGPVALRAGLLDREKPLLQANLAGAVAGRAGLGLGAGLGAGTVAGFGGFDGREAGLGFRARGSLREWGSGVVGAGGTPGAVGGPATHGTGRRTTARKKTPPAPCDVPGNR